MGVSARSLVAGMVLSLLLPGAAVGMGNDAIRLPEQGGRQVREWIARLQGPERDWFVRAVTRAKPLAPMVARSISSRGLPGWLIYLPMVESAYRREARSQAGAVGLWQLMPATAAELGLEVNSWLDERYDPWRSTPAAIDHLALLARRYRGDWLLSLAAYNCGIGCVDRALAGTSPGEFAYWRIQSRLPRETRDYVPFFLAVATVGASPSDWGFTFPDPGPNPHLIRVEVPPATPLSLVAKVWNLSPDTVKDLNPALRRATTPPGRVYGVIVPAERAQERQQHLLALLNQESAR